MSNDMFNSSDAARVEQERLRRQKRERPGWNLATLELRCSDYLVGLPEAALCSSALTPSIGSQNPCRSDPCRLHHRSRRLRQLPNLRSACKPWDHRGPLPEQRQAVVILGSQPVTSIDFRQAARRPPTWRSRSGWT